MGFNLNRIWIRSNRNKDSLSLGIYNQRPSFTVFSKEGGEPVFKFPLSDECIIQMLSYINKLIKDPASQKYPIFSMEYDRDTKEYKKNGQFTFVKDDKGLYYIEVASAKVKPPIVFPLRAPISFDVSGDGLSDTDRSTLTLEVLAAKLKELFGLMPLSEKIPMNNRGNYSGKSRTTGSSDSSNDENIFD